MIGQLVLVIALVAAINRMPVGLAMLLFLLYSATVGVTFALLFELYTTESIFTAFLVTAGMFGALAIFGRGHRRWTSPRSARSPSWR